MIQGFEDVLHLFAHEVEHEFGFTAAAHFHKRLQDEWVESGVRGDLALLLFAEEALAHDLLHGGAGGIPEILQLVPFGNESLHFLLECQEAFGELDDRGRRVVVAALHGLGSLVADALFFLGEGVTEEREGA